MAAIEFASKHEGPIVIFLSMVLSAVVMAFVPIELAGILGDSSVMAMLGALLVGALVGFVVTHAQIQAIWEQIALVPDNDSAEWREAAWNLDHLESEVKQDVCFVLAMFAVVFVWSCVAPALSALTGLDSLFAMFKMFSIITSVAAILNIVGPVPRLDEALMEIIAYNDAYRDDRLDEALKCVIDYTKARNDDRIY